MSITPGHSKDVWSFGPFILAARERLLTKDGVPVELGARALDLLVALISTPNEVVSKKDLLSRVWPDVTVEENSLRFHLVSLRKALGDGKDGARYITTLPGRGYCFVATVSRGDAPEAPAKPSAEFHYANLPIRSSQIVGRDDDVTQLCADLARSRLVTIVGTGGVGKTTVALAVAQRLAETFAGSVLFVDLGMVADPQLAPSTIASMLGQPVQSNDAIPRLLAYLKDRHILLVLDNCEHLLEAVARLADTIIEAASKVHILATSREAMRVDAEHVYRLDVLACPPDGAAFSAAAIREFPATRLFVERAMASGAHLDLTEEDAGLIADICRKLDGVALAIELAARRVESHGLRQTAALLDERLARLWQGSRTAPPRQKTLQATLDWSYGLLSDEERAVLRGLAVFVGPFTLDAALDVVSSTRLDRSTVFSAIDSLVAKSMLATRPIGAMMRYRLLDTTRSYALEIETEPSEAAGFAARHANYYRRWLDQSGTEWATLTTGVERAPHFAGLNNVRSALVWCFDGNGDAALGVRLAATAAPVFLAMSLLPECYRWSERALQTLAEADRGGKEEMQLQASLGLSLMYISGHSQVAGAALKRSLEVASARGDRLNEVRLLGPFFFYQLRSGEFKLCLDLARRCSDIASALEDAPASALAHTLMGIALTIMGDLTQAWAELEAALEAETAAGSRKIHFGFDHYTWVRVAKISLLSQQGRSHLARAMIRDAFAEVERNHHPVWLAVLINSAGALLWMGDLDEAQKHLDVFISRAESEAFEPYLHLGHALKGELAICRGDLQTGVEILQHRLHRLHEARYRLFSMRLQTVLARGLADCGRVEEALKLVKETAQQIAEKGYTSYLPELLRVEANILLGLRRPKEAETCFRQSLDLSRAQGSRAWELRTTTDLAAYWAREGRAAEARTLLEPVLQGMIEASDTPDVRTAESLLTELG